MKIKLKDILQLNNVLKAIIDNNELKIDPLFKFKLLGILKNIETPIMNFEVIRKEKIMEYGTETKNGNVQIPKEDAEAIKKYNDSLFEVLDSDVAINVEKLKVSDVFDKGLPADYLVGLYPIIEE